MLLEMIAKYSSTHILRFYQPILATKNCWYASVPKRGRNSFPSRRLDLYIAATILNSTLKKRSCGGTSVASYTILFFLEDIAQEAFIPSLIERLIKEEHKNI